VSSAAKKRFLRLQALYRHGDYESAANAVATALRAAPKDPNLLHLAAQIAEAQNALPRAVMMYRRALDAHPDWLEATYNLARVLGMQGQLQEALALMTKVSVMNPDLPIVWEGLAKLHQQTGELPVALKHWQKALSLVPHNQAWRTQYFLLARQLCDWDVQILDIEKLPPQAVTVLVDDPELQKQSAMRYARERFGGLAPLPPKAPEVHERLRIGYLSSDFHAHATAYLIAELFSLHNRNRFEVFAYSYGIDDKSAIRARLKEEAEHFVELNNLTPLQAAQRIRDDGIDILVDLKGYTKGGKLEILGYKPAPVQVHWLGYPGTLGTSFIDYFIADNITIPTGCASSFTEKILYLSPCYQINDRHRTAAQPLPRAAYGLPDDCLVLASFNQTYKITPDIFASWCVILKQTPHSVLWLYQSNPYAPDKLRQTATKHGVDPSRLVFASPLPLAEHLARYAYVDLCLDTFPVGGHTTTSDALWCGVPVVTIAGKSFVSRVAASVLSAAGLPELIATNMEDYKNLILKFSHDKATREGLKKHLSNKHLSLPLFETAHFVNNLETVYLEIKP